jgi:LacI family gluconate utilization system Gnt-I transcriptional repressor
MAVGFSHAEVGRAVARFFVARGWRRLGIATADDERALARRDGFVAEVGRDVPTAVVPAPSSMERGRHALAELLQRSPRLQAVCCSSDSMAQGVLTEARARSLRVPEDLAVCGFGDADFAAHLEPSLTTVRVDGAEIGRRAAEMVLARCEGRPVAQPKLDVGFEIVERASTGVAPRPARATSRHRTRGDSR